MSRPVASYAIEYGIPHNVLNNAIRDGFRCKPWGLKAHKVPWGRMYAVEQIDFDFWYQRYQKNRQKRKVKTMDCIEQISFTGLKFDNGSFLCISCLDVRDMKESNIINVVQVMSFEENSSLKCIKCNKLFVEDETCNK